MNSFDATSGTIDALLAVAVYAALIFGVRAVVHRVRRTEANPSNNKWMWLSALGLAAAVLVSSGSMSAEPQAADTETDRCVADGIRAAFDAPAAGLTADSSVREKNYAALRSSHVVVNNPECFRPGLVADAQAYITAYK